MTIDVGAVEDTLAGLGRPRQVGPMWFGLPTMWRSQADAVTYRSWLQHTGREVVTEEPVPPGQVSEAERQVQLKTWAPQSGISVMAV